MPTTTFRFNAMPTIFETKGKNYDLVCWPGFMYAGFKTATILNTHPVTIGPTTFEQLTQIRTIGKKTKGRQSAGFAVVDMIPPAALSYAGTFDGLILFHSHPNGPGSMQFLPPGPGKKIKGTKYFQMYVAFNILDHDLMFTTQGQAGRIVSPDVVLVQ